MTDVKMTCVWVLEWTAPLTSLAPLHLWPCVFIQFATGVRHQQGGLCEDRVRTRRAAQRWVQWTLCSCVSGCLYVGTYHFIWDSSPSVFSGPVSWSVLPLWRGSAEWTVYITRRKLWEELWWLLIESGQYLPTYCHFPTSGPHPLTSFLPFPVSSPHFSSQIPLYNS